MSKILKSICILVTLLMVIGMSLMGCSQNNNPQSSQSGSTSQSQSQAEELKQVQLTMYLLGDFAREYDVMLEELNEKMIEAGTKGVLVHMLPRNITGDRQEMSRILEKTDIFVDASSRDNTYDYIVDNKLLGRLKKDAIIVDLTADPYIVDEEGMQVKAIEGVPTGNLDKYVIYKEDKEYYDIPEEVDKENRRTVISCDAWPGVKPKECMELYGIQMLPIITKLFEKDVDDMGIESPYYFERAIYRATIEYFENHEKKK